MRIFGILLLATALASAGAAGAKEGVPAKAATAALAREAGELFLGKAGGGVAQCVL